MLPSGRRTATSAKQPTIRFCICAFGVFRGPVHATVDICDKWHYGRTPRAVEHRLQISVLSLTRAITAASCRFNIPFSAAAARGSFMAQPETSRNCITMAFAHQLISRCIFHSTFTLIRRLQQ
jgi:hypothetical protein